MRIRVYETFERPSVRPSVCPVDGQQQRRASGLTPSVPRAGDIDRLQAPALSNNGARPARHGTRSVALISKCGQRHVDSRRRRLNTDSSGFVPQYFAKLLSPIASLHRHLIEFSSFYLHNEESDTSTFGIFRTYYPAQPCALF